MKKAHRSELLKAIKEKFPEVRASLSKEDGLLTDISCKFCGHKKGLEAAQKSYGMAKKQLMAQVI